jgi:hypothetical protein
MKRPSRWCSHVPKPRRRSVVPSARWRRAHRRPPRRPQPLEEPAWAPSWALERRFGSRRVSLPAAAQSATRCQHRCRRRPFSKRIHLSGSYLPAQRASQHRVRSQLRVPSQLRVRLPTLAAWLTRFVRFGRRLGRPRAAAIAGRAAARCDGPQPLSTSGPDHRPSVRCITHTHTHTSQRDRDRETETETEKWCGLRSRAALPQEHARQRTAT